MAQNLKRRILDGIEAAFAEAGEDIAYRMRIRLAAGNHVDTGELYNSIRQETTVDGSQVVTRIYADAKAEDGTQYAEFVERGSGIYRDGGRQTAWRYKDRDGNWHTTHGMRADPFIEPSVAEVVPSIAEYITAQINAIDKYRRG